VTLGDWWSRRSGGLSSSVHGILMKSDIEPIINSNGPDQWTGDRLNRES
jgi:hypothetical protein